MSHPVAITANADFTSKVLRAAKPVVVDFWADWCHPCKQLSPIIDQLAGTFDGQADFVKVNTDDHLQLAVAHNVTNLPTVLIFAGGEVVKEFRGPVTKFQIRRALEEVC